MIPRAMLAGISVPRSVSYAGLILKGGSHLKVSIRTAKSMNSNRFFYNMVTTTWVLKHVLFVIDYKALTMHGLGKQRSSRQATIN